MLRKAIQERVVKSGQQPERRLRAVIADRLAHITASLARSENGISGCGECHLFRASQTTTATAPTGGAVIGRRSSSSGPGTVGLDIGTWGPPPLYRPRSPAANWPQMQSVLVTILTF